jgi:hypothetical protein
MAKGKGALPNLMRAARRTRETSVIDSNEDATLRAYDCLSRPRFTNILRESLPKGIVSHLPPKTSVLGSEPTSLYPRHRHLGIHPDSSVAWLGAESGLLLFCCVRVLLLVAFAWMYCTIVLL